MPPRKADVITMPIGHSSQDKRVVEPTQGAIDALPPDGGEWKVRGVLGLLVWSGKNRKSFRLVRRVHGRLVKRTLEARSLAEAKREVIRVWRSLTPKPVDAQSMPTLQEAVESYLSSKQLADRTRREYEAVMRRYVGDWLGRRLDAIAADRAGFRRRILEIGKNHGAATAALLLRTYRAIHNWHRKVLTELPESPTVACESPRVRPRDWALSDEELQHWWSIVKGLSPVKRVWWLTALLTGARAGSITMLKWQDVDLQRRVIRFRVAKGDRPYLVPMAERLAVILREYKDREWLPNRSGWVFPSPRLAESPLYGQMKTKGLRGPHSLRHTMRTRLAEAGATPDLARIALGHSLTQDVSQRYITPHLLVEAVRPLFNAVAEKYAHVLGCDGKDATGQVGSGSNAG